MCKEKGKNVSRETLSLLCGGIDARSIDVQITRLRKKLEENPGGGQFIPGRAGEIVVEKENMAVGRIGEVHPLVLENFGLQVPAAAFELEI